jgi:hypothetical protein
MEIVLSFELEADGLLGKPREYNPRLAVWTTDPTQRRTVTRGKSTDWHVLQQSGPDKNTYVTLRPTIISPTVLGDAAGKLIFPVNDPMEEVCVALYVDSEQGTRHHHGPSAVVCLGHVFIPWHVILRFMVSDGHALLSHDPSATTPSANLFPETHVKQEVSALITRDGIDYRVASLGAHRKTHELAVRLSKMDAQDVSHKATLGVKAGLLMPTSALLQFIDFPERLKLIERFLIERCPPHRMSKKPEGIDHFTFALQQYDAMTNERDRLVANAMLKYQQVYESLWSEDKKRALLVQSGSGNTKAHIAIPPNVPSMSRFHLPTWAPSGNERIPFVMWWKASLPRFAEGHFPMATEMTEQWLAHLLTLGLRRAAFEKTEFIAVLRDVTLQASATDLDALRRYALVGTKEYFAFLRVRETVDYMISSLSHASHYSHDQRFANAKFYYSERKKRMRKMLFQYDVESPQHDIAAGVNQDGDCEDLETLIMILDDLIKLGRAHIDEDGRSWSLQELKLLRAYLSLMAHYSNFGSVDGAQVKDAQGKEELEGFIRSEQDLSNEIGGHMYSLTESLVRTEYRFTKHRKLVILLYGQDLGALLHEHTEKILMHWVHNDKHRADLLREVYLRHPGAVHEGTGRQECLLLPNEDYFGMSDELLTRAAQHIAEIDVVKNWPEDGSKVEPAEEEESSSEDEDEEEKETTRAASSAPTIFVGEPLNYGFQRRLMSDSRWSVDVQSGKRSERHLSPFYRRLGSSFCPDLNIVAPRVFNHLIWISVPSKEEGDPDYEAEEVDDEEQLVQGVTFGPTLRDFLNLDGGALPLPLPARLAETYEGSEELVAAFRHRMCRVIPCDFSFRHLRVEESGDKEKKKKSVQAGDALEPNGELSAPAMAGRDTAAFFARCEHRTEGGESAASSSPSSERTLHGKTANQGGDIMITYIDTKGAVARIMRARNLGSSWSRSIKGRFNVVASRSPDQVSRIAELLYARPGVCCVEIIRERILPNLPDLLCIYFDRRHRFVIDDDKVEALKREAEEKSREKQKQKKQHPQSRSAWIDSMLESTPMAERVLGLHGKKKDEPRNIHAGFDMESVRQVAHIFKVDTSIVSLDRLQRGMNVELEHGTRYEKYGLNVTNNIPMTTAKIALAHLYENPGQKSSTTGEWLIPDYYVMLDAMEEDADRQWKTLGSARPQIFLPERSRGTTYGTFNPESEDSDYASTSSDGDELGADDEEGEERGYDPRLLPAFTDAALWDDLPSSVHLAAQVGRVLHTVPIPSQSFLCDGSLSSADIHH